MEGAKKSQRSRLSSFVVDFLSVCQPDRPLAEIEQSVALLSDETLKILWQEIFQQVTTDNTKYAAEVYSQNGWFMDMEFPGAPAPRIADLYEVGRGEEADAILARYYQERLDPIRDGLTHHYPARKTLLLKAFQKHSEANYDISIPLFLIQADGICFEVFGREFFRIKNDGLAARKSIDSANVDWIWNALAEPFRSVLPIAAHARTSKSLNRHQILHGHRLDYGTEINSLKAISLLSFLHGLDSYRGELLQRRQAQDAILAEVEESVRGQPT